MKLKHVLPYFVLQLLAVNLCVAVACLLFPLVWNYVNTILFILLLPIGSGFAIGRLVGSRFGDESLAESFTAANGLVGILVAVFVGVVVYNGGMEYVKSFADKPVTGITPSQAVDIDNVSYLEFADARRLEDCAHSRVAKSRTVTGPQRSVEDKALHHTETHTVVPVVDQTYKPGDPVSVWLCQYKVHSESKDGWSDTSHHGEYDPDDLPIVSGLVVVHPWRLGEYRTAAAEAVAKFRLREADRVHYIQHVPDYPGWHRRRVRFAAIALCAGNLLLVLLPTIIYPFAIRPKSA